MSAIGKSAYSANIVEMQRKVERFCDRIDGESAILLQRLKDGMISLSEFRKRKMQLEEIIPKALLLFKKLCRQAKANLGGAFLNGAPLSGEAVEMLKELQKYISSH